VLSSSWRFNVMPRLVELRPAGKLRLWLRYDDGTEGEVDLSDLSGRGVFKRWERPGAFESVTLTAHGAPSWGGDLDLCPDALYLRLTGKRPEDIFPALRREEVDA
jgi:hypothetical protein